MKTADELLASALLAWDPDQVREMARMLGRAGPPVPKAAAMVLGRLAERPDTTEALLGTHHRPALSWLASELSNDCLERTIVVLGAAADNPTRLELTTALQVVGGEVSVEKIRMMLANTAAADLPASGLCFDLLTEPGLYHLDVDPRVTAGAQPAPSRIPSSADPEVKERRRLRREADRAARQAGRGSAPAGRRPGGGGRRPKR